MTDEPTTTVRTKLSALWAALTLLYVYADVLSLFRPGQLDEITEGRMGPVDATQATLLLAAVIVVVPAFMVFLTLILRTGPCRWANLGLGVLYAAVSVGNLAGETWAYYLLFGVLEITVTGLIVRYAWKWPPSRAVPPSPSA